MNNQPRQITYSMFTAWLSCRQKFDYRYNQCIVPRENAVALAFGSAVHAGLETWFKSHDIDKAVEMADRSDLSDTDRVKATELVRGYWEKYPRESFTVIDIEREFSTPLINPKTGCPSKTWELAGKVDGIIEQNGELYILEHKTTSKADDDYFNRVEIDMQLAFYAIAIQQVLERPVVGALYDVIEKPAIRLKTNEDIDSFRLRVRDDIDGDNYVRRFIRFADGFLTMRQSLLWAMCREIRHGAICPNTSACLQFSTCPYLPLCRAFGDLQSVPEFYTKRPPHEELSHVVRN